MTEKPKGKDSEDNKVKRSRVNQTDMPAYTLDDALRVPAAIIENYASQPTDTLMVAKAMDMPPSSTQFRMLTGAATAYGLTEGGAWAEQIKILPLATKIIQARSEEARIQGKREALLQTRIFREFLKKYDGSPLPPKEEIAYEILKQLGVPADRTEKTFRWIVQSADSVGFLEEIKGKKYVYLSKAIESQKQIVEQPKNDLEYDEDDEVETETTPSTSTEVSPIIIHTKPATDDKRKRRVFITHGKNRNFLELIKKLLSFGELEPVVSVEKQGVSEPIPDKVMNEMRSCGAAIIHVDAEQKLMDAEANAHIVLNPNVLIEIGAAMALYGRRFILLVKEGISLPSNLQGLYEVRYSGESLDGDTTVRLLEAINQMKQRENDTQAPS